MKVTRIYSDADGNSHFGMVERPLIERGDIGALSELEGATGIIFRRTPGEYDYAWHNTPRRQYVIMLEGGVEFEVSSGEKRRFYAGDVVLLEDTTGRGHCSRAINRQPRYSIFVTLD
ncbi:MAG: cupin domain-containing protein [Anaerolineae bacterium]